MKGEMKEKKEREDEREHFFLEKCFKTLKPGR